MFNYIHETIINDAAACQPIKNNSDKVVGALIKRAGNYDLAKIVDGKIYRTVGVEGKQGWAVLAPKDLDPGQLARITINVKTPGTEFLEFASPNWQEFSKPVVVETSAESAADLAAALKLALNEDNKLFTIKVGEASETGPDGSTPIDGKVLLVLAESWMNFAEINYDIITEAGELVTPGTTEKIVASVPEFATAKWLVENLRFPTYPNRRYAPLYADEAPVAGQVYTQYTFEYHVKRSVPGGLAAVGQVVDSITTMVFYVAPAAKAAFETAFTSTDPNVTIAFV